MGKVPRHRFVPSRLSDLAYADDPLPIGQGQTISQPYIVALMTELIEPRKQMRVLEIGTGSGYQAAVLAECVGEVDTIEVVPELGRAAASRLRELGYRSVHTRIGDGYEGWPECAPFDAIVLTAAPPAHPRALAGSAQGWRPPRGAGWPRGPRSGAAHADRERVRPRGHRAGAVRADDGQGTAGTLTGFDGVASSRLSGTFKPPSQRFSTVCQPSTPSNWPR